MSDKPLEELIPVPVPRGAMPAVIGVLNDYYASNGASAAAPERSASSTVPQESVPVPGNGEWTRDEILDLHSRFKNPIGRAVIRPIAEAGGEPVTYGELAEAAGITIEEVRPQLAWFSKYSKAVKGLRDGKAWPMTVSESPKLPKEQRYTYRMPRQVGEWWLEADDDASS
jgi:hypothetical protein